MTRFRQLAADSSSDEMSGALLVNEALDPGVDGAAVRARADELADRCPEGTLPWAWMEEQGFAGNRDNYVDTANSCIAEVLSTRRGIPISLAVLLVHIARRRGHDARGINFPGHFLARIDGVLVDPFGFQAVTEAACLERLQRGQRHGAFEVADSSTIALRMLNNVKFQFMGMARWDRVLDLVDFQLALSPDAAHLLMEKGRAWEELGAPDVAKRIYEGALGAPGGAAVRESVESRLKQLSRAAGTWH
ncbi:MAG: transglutaminase-like domain-containing protein [Gammaproteobacteria bacterium]|nr:transglutaminase-like domain-containing protein [Gammaproteobacteria bacterium]